MKTILNILVLASIFFTIGCIDVIVFPTKAEQEFLSFEGSFNNLEDTQYIRLFLSKGYESSPERVGGAKIKLFDNDTLYAEYQETELGVYVLTPKKRGGKIGNRYNVEIGIRGKTYRSEAEIMPAPIKPDSVSFSVYNRELLSSIGYKIETQVLKVLINTPLKNKNTDGFLRWDIEDSFDFNTLPECGGGSFAKSFTCYYSRNRMPNSRVVVASSKTSKLSKAFGFAINETSLEVEIAQFKDTHYWLISQKSITEKAYNYWKYIDEISSQVGSVFDITPAYLKGNIYNVNDPEEKVLGYFEVASTERITGFIYGTYINQNLISKAKQIYPCAGEYTQAKFSLCCTCPGFEIPGWSNSEDKPYYWK
jgi:Domain of unknown function (DUF4249)